MKTIERSTAFKKDFKHVKSMPRYRKNLDFLLSSVLELLLLNKILPEINCDHPLSGNWNGYRACHIKPDFINLSKAR